MVPSEPTGRAADCTAFVARALPLTRARRKERRPLRESPPASKAYNGAQRADRKRVDCTFAASASRPEQSRRPSVGDPPPVVRSGPIARWALPTRAGCGAARSVRAARPAAHRRRKEAANATENRPPCRAVRWVSRCVRACVRAYVRTCVRACVRVRVCVCVHACVCEVALQGTLRRNMSRRTTPRSGSPTRSTI